MKPILTTVETSSVLFQHNHDIPLEDVIIRQPTADARNVLVVLHLLELPA